MLIRSLMKIIGVGVLALCTSTLMAQDGPPYPPDYTFGADGNEGHPNGYDGYPGGHANNTNSPHGGHGGNGIGSGNGGYGGSGVSPGGHGGHGGNSGPDGGSGGDGGVGGSDSDGTGGNGGDGGLGVDSGGDGGTGGGGESGGGGGDGGNATGENGEAGDGGNGGTATDGIAGNGGGGGNAPDAGGCGGDGGDGGNFYDDGGSINPQVGLPGLPGRGTGGLPSGEGCDGELGNGGKIIPTRSALGEIMPIGLKYAASFHSLHLIPSDDEAQLDEAIRYWSDSVGSEISIGSRRFPPYSFDHLGVESYECLLHIDSLNADTIRIELEARAVGSDPMLQIFFGVAGEFGMTSSIPMPLEDDWNLYRFTISRPEAGVALGTHLDMFIYSGRDMDVRSFRVNDLGKKGDVNNDAVVDAMDLIIVTGNYAQQGDVGIEGGDTNLDGVVDTEDVLNVINGIE